MDDDRDISSGFGLAIGGIGPVAVAGLLVGVRGHILNANVALLLVVVVVVAGSVGGRAAGAVGAVSATLSFDFFHTVPYNSLVITSGDDLETALVLLVVGVAVGQMAIRARTNRAAAKAGRSEVDRIYRLAELTARGEEPADVILAAQAELLGLLTLKSCRFEALPYDTVFPRLERSGGLGRTSSRFSRLQLGRQGFEFPPQGVELPVLSRGQPVGRFVLEPTPGVGASLEQRVVAVALADQVGAALVGDRTPAAGPS